MKIIFTFLPNPSNLYNIINILLEFSYTHNTHKLTRVVNKSVTMGKVNKTKNTYDNKILEN